MSLYGYLPEPKRTPEPERAPEPQPVRLVRSTGQKIAWGVVAGIFGPVLLALALHMMGA
jgi:hypothetical protein